VTAVAPTRRPPRRRRRPWRALLLAAGAAAVFAVGVAVGEALHDAPQPGGTRTYVRTLRPGTVSPSVRTVTVVTTG
jgi:ferric-dicitrate binding protein FerR (iron transport regulator)